ncbi:MAG TPA: hypothetical protein P5556_08380 [Candidatus Gastranaerophilales bacterium]|nr:hypothetical protein [Candidatus Gastranaerophilales bacterium]
MSIVQGIKNQFNGLSWQTPVNCAKKTATVTISTLTNKKVMYTTGALAGLIALYRIFTDGPHKGLEHANEEMGKDYADLFIKAGKSSKHSHFLEVIKEPVTLFLFDSSVHPAYVKTKNVIFSTAMETVNNAITLSAAAGAIAAPMLLNNPIGIGIGAVSTGILLLRGASFILHDVLGVGKKGL